jgi:hypothetical protein
MTRPNPFALSTCGRFVVERQEGEIYPNVMLVREAVARQQRNEVAAASYEADFDRMHGEGRLFDAGIARDCASVALTIAAEIAEALNGATGSLSDRRAA